MTQDQRAARSSFPDWRFAPNIGGSPDVYEIENRALDRGGHVLDAMRALAPWAGRTLVDLGCGTGFWLPRYAAEAAEVIGIEPDSALLTRAEQRIRHLPSVRVAAGSAEHLGLPARSVDVVHARFAYFFTPNGDAGLTEVLRALRPGGSLVVVDNDYRWGEFATLLAASAPRDGPGTKNVSIQRPRPQQCAQVVGHAPNFSPSSPIIPTRDPSSVACARRYSMTSSTVRHGIR